MIFKLTLGDWECDGYYANKDYFFSKATIRLKESRKPTRLVVGSMASNSTAPNMITRVLDARILTDGVSSGLAMTNPV